MLQKLKAKAKKLKTEIYALYLAYQDPGTPWYAKILIAVIVAYALSPIDLIPDFIPVLGILDDLILLPIGIYFAIKIIPEPVLTECRQKAQNAKLNKKKNWIAGIIIICLWILAVWWVIDFFIGRTKN
jgi:uncharacterized membrane protein YkvA (DUF1232 family)